MSASTPRTIGASPAITMVPVSRYQCQLPSAWRSRYSALKRPTSIDARSASSAASRSSGCTSSSHASLPSQRDAGHPVTRCTFSLIHVVRRASHAYS